MTGSVTDILNNSIIFFFIFAGAPARCLRSFVVADIQPTCADQRRNKSRFDNIFKREENKWKMKKTATSGL
jgi:hypothetical protein